MLDYGKYAIIRDKKGMKDSAVAQKAGIYQSIFTDWKKGTSEPKLDKLTKIASALEVDMSWLLSELSGMTVDYRTAETGAMFEPTESEQIAHLYENADDYTKDLVKRILRYEEEIGS